MRWVNWTRRTQLMALTSLGILVFVVAWNTPQLIVNYRVKRASEALEKHRFDSALDSLIAAQRLKPHDGKVHYLLARTYRRMERFSQVRYHLEQAAQNGYPVDDLRRENLLALAQAGQVDEAEPHLVELLNHPDAEKGEIFFAFVTGYFRAFRFDSAFRILDIWTTESPQAAEPYVLEGVYWANGLAWSQAVDAFSKAVKRAPERWRIRLKLAKALERLQRYDQAAEHFRRCRQQAPDDPDVRLGWAVCLLEQGEDQRARQILEQLIEAEPENVAVQAAWGRLELEAGRPQQALKWLEPAVAEQPYNRPARAALAAALQATGKADRAREHSQYLSQATEADNRVAELLSELRESPDSKTTRLHIARLVSEYGSPAKGAAWLHSVLKVDPENQEAHKRLAAYYADRGNQEQAEHHREFLESAVVTR